MIEKIRKDNLRENIITYLIVLFMIIIVGFSVYSSDKEKRDRENEKQNKINEYNREKEYYDNLKIDKPTNFEMFESPEKVDILRYKNKSIEYYNLMNIEMSDNIINHYDALDKIQEILYNFYDEFRNYSNISTIDGLSLKKILLKAKDCNEKIYEIIGGNSGIYLYVGISKENTDIGNFQKGGFTDPNQINNLINIIINDLKYNFRIIRQYGMFGISDLNLFIYDNYKKNEDYTIGYYTKFTEPAHLTQLDKSLFDILTTSNKHVTGSIIKICLDEVISYNSMRDDPENAILVDMDISNDNRKFHESNINKIDDIKQLKYLVEDNKSYYLSSDKMGTITKYGYMYTYKIMIKE